jgi:release factor glutamine methyltransferase
MALSKFLDKSDKSLLPLWSVIDAAAAQLDRAGIADPRWEARLLLGHALGLDGATLLRERDRLIEPDVLTPWLDRRRAREPLAFILGRQDFWTLSLATDPCTLVPRGDSETLIEAALGEFPARDAHCVLDLGTGTGCLLLAALSVFPAAFGIGVDRQPAAALLARRNAASAGLAGRSAFLCGDWAAALSAQFDLILCNPPYIRHDEIAGLMPEVASYEPISALDGGADGLDAYRIVIGSVPSLLNVTGVAILELGVGQVEAVSALALAADLRCVGTRLDLNGIPRALILRRGVP